MHIEIENVILSLAWLSFFPGIAGWGSHPVWTLPIEALSSCHILLKSVPVSVTRLCQTSEMSDRVDLLLVVCVQGGCSTTLHAHSTLLAGLLKTKTKKEQTRTLGQ